MAFLIAVAALAATALIFAMAGWNLNTWVGAPALTRVFGEFLCGAALCRAAALSHEAPLPNGDLLGAGAFAAFLIGASANLEDFALVGLLALTIFGTATSTGPLMRVLGSWPFVWLGEISYSLYMVHFPILIIIRRFWERLGFEQWPAGGKLCAVVATVAFVIAVAAMLFYVVERPARTRLRDRAGKVAKEQNDKAATAAIDG
jgi:peptidoglycan/LPS O-acetylase OafA/YrhL